MSTSNDGDESYLDRCPHGHGLGSHCPSGFCGDGSGTGIVVESDLMRAVMASRRATATAQSSRPIEPGRLLPLLAMAFEAEARGWGPDVTEITLTCPKDGCAWEYTYEESTSIGEMVERVAAHEHRYLRSEL